MISYLKNLKINKLNRGMTRSIFTQGHPEYFRGMTYIELIVVLSIFATMSSIIAFNHGKFQGKVDVKSMASDIALKIVEAQKSSLSGNLPSGGTPFDTWKPSYGVRFNIATKDQFIYFVDLDNANGDDEKLLETIRITKNNYISNINLCSDNPCDLGNSPINSFSVFFERPRSSANFTGVSVTGSNYVQITIKSPKDATAFIKIWPSGRIQVN